MVFQKLCWKEEVGFEDLWGCFVGRADMYMRDGLHHSFVGRDGIPVRMPDS